MSAEAASLQNKTIVLCFDGTDSQYGANNTNVVDFFSLLRKDVPDRQVCYYQAGIGTFLKPGVVSPLFQWIAKILDEAIAWYLDAHVMDGYQFLMQNYNAGDKICLFGFSRGAYTARALGGMLYKVGLLGKDNDDQVPFAYKLFTSNDKTSNELSAGFKRTFCQDVKIEFMGVWWDTVASVGIISGRSLPFVNSNKAITTFRQALSLDEHRAKFRPNMYHRPTPNVQSPSFDPKHPTTSTSAGPSKTRGSDADETETDVLEVWFSGCHSDVGGGSVPDATEHSLAHITLRWMVRQVATSQCGILFNDEQLVHYSIPPTVIPAEPTQTPTQASPEELAEDSIDAKQPLYDPLVFQPIWWLLELVPLHYTWQDANNVWHTSYTFHLGKGRIIGESAPNFHVSVGERMNDASLKYRPKAIWRSGTEVYVE